MYTKVVKDEEFHKMFEEFDKKIDIFLEKEDFYNKYIAYFIAEEYKEKLPIQSGLPDIISNCSVCDNPVSFSRSWRRKYRHQ